MQDFGIPTVQSIQTSEAHTTQRVQHIAEQWRHGATSSRLTANGLVAMSLMSE